MSKQEFLQSKYFDHWGFVKPLDIYKGGRYTHVSTVYSVNDDKYFDIICDEQMNFYYMIHFPHGIVVNLEGGIMYDEK